MNRDQFGWLNSLGGNADGYYQDPNAPLPQGTILPDPQYTTVYAPDYQQGVPVGAVPQQPYSDRYSFRGDGTPGGNIPPPAVAPQVSGLRALWAKIQQAGQQQQAQPTRRAKPVSQGNLYGER